MTNIELLRGGLVVSCQPIAEGPMDHPNIIAAMAEAAVAGGAVGIRIEGVENLRSARPRVDVPIIGIVKRDLIHSEVRITPFLEDVSALTEAGADFVAIDATSRPRPESVADLVRLARALGAGVMADCATLDDARSAKRHGVDILGSTLSGYTLETATNDPLPDLALLRELAKLGGFVMAEGRYNSPSLARAALDAGADCVTVGSALTRLEHATAWFVEALEGARI